MISFKVILGVLFGLLITSIVGWGIVSYQNKKISVETAALVKHTHEVLELTDEISSLYKDIQLEGNGFFIMGDSSWLQPYNNAKAQLVSRVKDLQLFTNENPDQKLRTDSLLSTVTRLLAFTQSGLLQDKRNYTTEEVNQRLQTNFLYRQQIRKVIGNIKTEQRRLLVSREQAHEQSIAAFNKAFLLLMGGIAVLLATTFFSIRYNFNKRIKAQEEQKKATELFTRIFYESPMGIVMSRLDTGEILDCNNAYTDLVGFSKTDVIGKTAVQLGVVSDASQRNEIVNHVCRYGVTKDLEVQLKPNNSEPIWVSKSMQLIRINNEDCILSAVLDMTVHKEAEENIRRALRSEIELNKLKSNFVTLASHEFRTPLTTILSSAFLLENYSFADKEKAGKHVARIKGSVKLLTSILDEFLSVTKIEEGKIEAKNERINIKETLEKLCSDLRTFARPGQKIVYEHSGYEEIDSDPVLLGNIVNNLVSNAIKYSHDNAEIRVSTTVTEKFGLSVKDNGIGISKEDQQHLFERFFRASNAGNVQGTGLGLHILKHYVDLLHGSVEVDSEPGKGSEFNITFDLQQRA